MAKIPQQIEADHVYQAIEAFASGVEHAFGESRDYDLLYEGKR